VILIADAIDVKMPDLLRESRKHGRREEIGLDRGMITYNLSCSLTRLNDPGSVFADDDHPMLGSLSFDRRHEDCFFSNQSRWCADSSLNGMGLGR